MSWLLMWIDSRGKAQGSGQRADLGVLPTLFIVLCAGSMCGTLLLLLALQKWQLGFIYFFVFLYLVACNFPQQLFLVPVVSLYFPTQGGICPGANPVARHPRSQRLLSQQVSPRLALSEGHRSQTGPAS